MIFNRYKKAVGNENTLTDGSIRLGEDYAIAAATNARMA